MYDWVVASSIYGEGHVHGFLIKEEVDGFGVVFVFSNQNLVHEKQDLVVVPKYRLCVIGLDRTTTCVASLVHSRHSSTC